MTDTIVTQFDEAEVLRFPGALALTVLLTGRDTADAVETFEAAVAPGNGPPRHMHLNQDETFFFLEGTFEVEIGDAKSTLSAGDVAFIPRGTTHAFRNTGTSPARIRYLFTPAISMAEMFREFHECAQTSDATVQALADIAARHGQIFTGPPMSS